MDSINTDERVDGFLATMLEGYESNLQGVTQFIDQTEPQLEAAKIQRDEMLENITALKDILGVKEDSETSPMELVKEE